MCYQHIITLSYVCECVRVLSVKLNWWLWNTVNVFVMCMCYVLSNEIWRKLANRALRHGEAVEARKHCKEMSLSPERIPSHALSVRRGMTKVYNWRRVFKALRIVSMQCTKTKSSAHSDQLTFKENVFEWFIFISCADLTLVQWAARKERTFLLLHIYFIIIFFCPFFGCRSLSLPGHIIRTFKKLLKEINFQCPRSLNWVRC